MDKTKNNQVTDSHHNFFSIKSKPCSLLAEKKNADKNADV